MEWQLKMQKKKKKSAEIFEYLVPQNPSNQSSQLF